MHSREMNLLRTALEWTRPGMVPMSKPLVSDEEIDNEWNPILDTKRGHTRINAFARAIESLVRKRLAERLRAQSAHDGWGMWGNEAARIVEED